MAHHSFNPETEVSKVSNWRSRVQSEIKCQHDWDKQWGFLLPVHDSLDTFRKPSPRQAASSVLHANLLDTVRDKRQAEAANKDSLEDFVHVYCTRTGGKNSRLLPRQEFKKPLCASHNYGWRPTLEVFGNMNMKFR